MSTGPQAQVGRQVMQIVKTYSLRLCKLVTAEGENEPRAHDAGLIEPDGTAALLRQAGKGQACGKGHHFQDKNGFGTLH